jgi:hypothetical protein
MRVILFCVLFLCVQAGLTRAETLFSSDNFEGQLSHGRTVQTADAGRSRLVKLAPGTSWFSGRAKDFVAPSITFNLFSDLEVTAVLERKTSPGDGRSVLRGRIEGIADSYFLIANESNVIAGTIFLPNRGLFKIQYAGEGLHQVMEVDASKVPRCGVEDGIGAGAIPVSTADPERGMTAMTGGVKLTVVDVLVLYTEAARDGAGGSSGINTLIDLAAAEANMAYENSRVNLFLNVVEKSKVSYSDSGKLTLDISRLMDPFDGYLDDANARRKAANADLVCLLVERSDELAGIARQTANSTNAFSVVVRGYAAGYHVFAHELAHNFGCQHDRQNANTAGIYSYSYGWHFNVGYRTYGTVMSYVGLRIPYFSNPSVSFDGVATGGSSANNARTLERRMETVSAFSGTASTTLTPTVGIISPTDNSIVFVGSDLLLKAFATNGGVSRVEFYQNGVLLGSSAGPNFSFLLTNVPYGDLEITARAINNLGASTLPTPAVKVYSRYANDSFARRQSLTGTNTSVSFCNHGATLETGEPKIATNWGATVWFSWKAPMTGRVLWSIPEHSSQGLMGVFTGDSLAGLQLLTKTDFNAPVSFDVVKDVTYQIALGGYSSSGSEGCGTMMWRLHPPLGNDNFSNAIPIIGSSYHAAAHNVGTQPEPGESVPFPGSGYSVWWRWTAATNGELRVSSSTANVVLTPYLGLSASNLTPLARNGGTLIFNVVPGNTYYISADSSYRSYLEFDLDLQFTPGVRPPANDNFADRTRLVGTDIIFSGSTIGATREFGEPYDARFDYGVGGRSVWWTWTAPFTGRLSLNADHAGLLMGVYTGDNLTNLVNAGGNVLNVVAGTDYHIMVDAAGEPFTTSIRLEAVSRVADLSNNNFASRAVLSGSPIALVESTATATKEPGEPNHGNNPGGRSMWFTWTATNDGVVAIRVEGGEGGVFYPLLGVYEGAELNALVSRGQDGFGVPDWFGHADSSAPELSLRVTNGMTLQIAVDAYNGYYDRGAIGDFILKVQFTPVPPNDNFANRIPIIGSNQTVYGTNTAATLEPDEPVSYGVSQQTVWWTWTPSENSTASLTVRGPFDSRLAVSVGDSISALRWVVLGTTNVTFKATAGVPYQIAVDGALGDGGPFELSLASVASPPPVNDNFAAATILPGDSGTVQAANDFSTAEPGEPGFDQSTAAAHSIWWTWRAPGNGCAKFSLGGGVSSWLGIYTGSTLGTLQELGVTTIYGPYLAFPVSAGSLYHLKVDGDACACSVKYSFFPSPANDSFASRIVLYGDATFGATNPVYATREFGEPEHAGTGRGGSVWWCWTAPRTMWVTVTPKGPGAVAVYTGPHLGALTLKAGNGWGAPFAFNAVAGETYQIALASGYDCTQGCGLGPVTITGGASNPENDSFHGRLPITGTSAQIEAYNGAATVEPGEPPLGTGCTLWWTWTAPGRGVTRIRSDADDTALQVFTGGALSSLTRVVIGAGEVVFDASPGVTYQICVDKIRQERAGMLQFSLNQDLVVENDNFADRIFITGTNVDLLATNANATTEPGELVVAHGNTLWWTWTPPITGRVTISAHGSAVQVFQGDALSNLVKVATYPWDTFIATAGQQYHLSQDSAYFPNAPLSFSFRLTPAPTNDSFADASAIAGSFESTTTSNIGATVESGEPRFDDTNSNATIWWKWTATETRWMSILSSGNQEDFSMAGFDTYIGVYSGSSLSNLALVSLGTNRMSFLASAGTTYRIAVDGKGGALGKIGFRLSTTPSNDRFADRRLLQGCSASVRDSSVGAQMEPGEMGYVDPSGASVWFTWTAPIAGDVTINYRGANFYASVGVFTGTAVTNLEAIVGKYYNYPVSFKAVAGTTYQIAMAGYADGDYELNLYLNGGKTNDNFAQRIALLDTNLIVAGNNTGATVQSGEPKPQGYVASHSLWWSFAAPTNGSVCLDFSGTGFNPLIGIYTGTSLGNLKPVTNVMVYSNWKTVFDVGAATNYLISVDGFNGETGDIRYQLDFRPRPINDGFANRIPLSGDSIVASADSRGATMQAGEPKHAGLAGSRSLWWSWTAPRSEFVTWKVTGDRFSPRLAVYEGLALAALKSVASNYVAQVLSDHVTFFAEAGKTYQIAVDSLLTDFGQVSLAMVTTPRPVNDEFLKASVLSGTPVTVFGTNIAALSEPKEPSHAGFPE